MSENSDEKTRDVMAPGGESPGAPETGADLVHPYLGMMGAGPGAEEGTQALAGEPLPDGAAVAEPAAVEAALRSVYDPEIPVNIYDLGLIYRCDVNDEGDADIDMTLTAPACPVAGEMPQQVADAVAGVEGIGVVTVTLTWSPPWRPDMMSEDAKLALDLF
ncbi:MAG: DUF59 domain-containing protein [Marivibrio sp.]|uniref:DUF59 domain-containing protein n=1 Tax=Marivibrio sp. TaxID=2039719 RepID=UPI0032EF8BD2